MSTIDVQPYTSNIEQTQIDISVVVPFYNAQSHIEDCIKALLTQTYPRTCSEIIMVDNNSTDSSPQLVMKYPRIKLLFEHKQGSYAARNRGVAGSKGSIIAFTDADCVPFPDWLEEIAAPLQSPEVKVVLGGRLYAVESQALSMLETHESERAAFTFSGKSSDIYYGYTNNMAVRRDAFDRCSPFLEIERGADSIFVHQVIERYSCEVIQHAPEALIRHLEIRSVQKWFRKRFLYGRNFQKNYSRRKGSYRLLSNAESIAILKRTIQRKRCSALGALFLVILLWMGTLCYMSGRLSVRFAQSSSSM